MKFVDETHISVRAGCGGDGCLSFRRERSIPRGGPNGGDGGNGGDIRLVADTALNTLVDYHNQQLFRAGNGSNGGSDNQSGAAGADLELRVPFGTQIYNEETAELLCDIGSAQRSFTIAQGGQRGLGNVRFKSATNRAPRKTTKGRPGETLKLRLVLKLVADVGLLGAPNAGKSTLLAAISAARPAIADYPFTTRTPQLGTVRIGWGRGFVIADIPGLIAGAAQGTGLGTKFLRHLMRTRMLLHLVDMAPADGSSPAQQVRETLDELQQYSPELATRTRWLVPTKMDLLPTEQRQQRVDELIQALDWREQVYPITAIAREGTRPLCEALGEALERLEADADEDTADISIDGSSIGNSFDALREQSAGKPS